MPSISYDSLTHWSNYHLTIGHRSDIQSARRLDDIIPSLLVGDSGKIHTSDIEQLKGLERFAATGDALFSHLSRFEHQATHRGPTQPGKPMIGLIGRGWSFSELIGSDFSQLSCEGLSSVSELPKAHAHEKVDLTKTVLCGGGTRLRELVTWSENQMNITVETSGTHLGLTVAGAAGTASHGSKLGFGGMQNSVLGMHMIVGPGEHVWIEDPETPVLSQEGLAALAIDGLPVRFISSKEHFESALVHLGSMGIVNGLALRMAPNVKFAEMRRRAAIDDDWLAALSDGKFGTIAGRLNCLQAPAFYELTIDPHKPMREPAAHICYFETDQPESATTTPPLPRTADAMANFAAYLKDNMAEFIASEPEIPLSNRTHNWFDPPDDNENAAIQYMLEKHASAFSFYTQKGQFSSDTGPFDPKGPGVENKPWSALHPDEITGGVPGSLYNASFSIDRKKLKDAIPAITQAVHGLPPIFVFTVRFVSKPRGSLAFTRFPENAVIEIDGLSPLICELFALLAASGQDPKSPEARLFMQLSQTLRIGAKLVREALNKAKIDYSMHWAKLGDLDPAKVEADFGHSSSSDASLLDIWRNTREELLTGKWRDYFVNPEVKRLRLV